MHASQGSGPTLPLAAARARAPVAQIAAQKKLHGTDAGLCSSPASEAFMTTSLTVRAQTAETLDPEKRGILTRNM